MNRPVQRLEVGHDEVVFQPVVSTATELPVSTPSDARLKTNVDQLTDVLEKLEQIRGVSSEWNDTMKAKGMAGESSDNRASLLRRWKWY